MSRRELMVARLLVSRERGALKFTVVSAAIAAALALALHDWRTIAGVFGLLCGIYVVKRVSPPTRNLQITLIVVVAVFFVAGFLLFSWIGAAALISAVLVGLIWRARLRRIPRD